MVPKQTEPPTEPNELLTWLDGELRGVANEPRFVIENRVERRRRIRAQRRRTK